MVFSRHESDDWRQGARVDQSAAVPALKVGFVLLEKFTLAAFATFIDALRLAADRGGRSRQIEAGWSILGDRPVRASCGLRVLPDEPCGAPERFDYIAVCGGNAFDDRRVGRSCTPFLLEADARDVPLIGVCSGTFALAEAGLLGGHRVCVHWNVLEAFEERYPEVAANSDQLFLESGNRITCAGSMGGADLAFYLIRRHLGPEKAQQAARHMMLQTGRPAEYPQPHFLADISDTSDPSVRRTALLMEQSLNEFHSIGWFAEQVGLSVRQLERRFREGLGVTPAAFYRRLRLDYAASLLARTNLSVLETAIDCGFADGSHLTREFRKHFGCTPREFRTDSRTAAASVQARTARQPPSSAPGQSQVTP